MRIIIKERVYVIRAFENLKPRLHQSHRRKKLWTWITGLLLAQYNHIAEQKRFIISTIVYKILFQLMRFIKKIIRKKKSAEFFLFLLEKSNKWEGVCLGFIKSKFLVKKCKKNNITWHSNPYVMISFSNILDAIENKLF